MKKIKLYIATSLDGYIARKDGSLDWLDGIPNPDQLDYGYYDFYDSVDTLLMGRITYEEVLGFGVEWPYPDKKTFVVTQGTTNITTPHTFLIEDALENQIENLRKEKGKDIWLVGGGKLVSAMLDINAIDEMVITVTPVILGEGVPLFPHKPKETPLKLIESKAFSTGFVNLVYQKV